MWENYAYIMWNLRYMKAQGTQYSSKTRIIFIRMNMCPKALGQATTYALLITYFTI